MSAIAPTTALLTTAQDSRLWARLEAQFWAMVDVRGPDDCWEFTGYRYDRGYGKFRNTTAHRFAWRFTNGPIPVGLVVCHSCDWPPCCNPTHLFLGTQAENIADAMAKGRHSFGERHPRSRLTEAAVREIRDLYARGDVTIVQLAAKYGLSPEATGHVIRRYSWKRVA
jgi:hypothetical protein